MTGDEYVIKWHWKVRINNRQGHYWIAQVTTGRDLREIAAIQDFYATLTGCKILLAGMSEREFDLVAHISEAFAGLWLSESKRTPVARAACSCETAIDSCAVHGRGSDKGQPGD